MRDFFLTSCGTVSVCRRLKSGELSLPDCCWHDAAAAGGGSSGGLIVCCLCACMRPLVCPSVRYLLKIRSFVIPRNVITVAVAMLEVTRSEPHFSKRLRPPWRICLFCRLFINAAVPCGSSSALITLRPEIAQLIQ